MRHQLGDLLARHASSPPPSPPPAAPVERWLVGCGASRCLPPLCRQTGQALERLAYARIPDAFSATEGSPDPNLPFEERWEAYRVLELLVARGRPLAEIRRSLLALRAAGPLLDHRPPEAWSAAEVAAAVARVIEAPGATAAAEALCDAAHALWSALDRHDRIDGFAEFLRAAAEG